MLKLRLIFLAITFHQLAYSQLQVANYAKIIPDGGMEGIYSNWTNYLKDFDVRKTENNLLTKFILDKNGLPKDVQVYKSSNYALLDSLAVTFIKTISFTPYIDIWGDKREVEMYIPFSLTNEKKMKQILPVEEHFNKYFEFFFEQQPLHYLTTNEQKLSHSYLPPLRRFGMFFVNPKVLTDGKQNAYDSCSLFKMNVDLKIREVIGDGKFERHYWHDTDTIQSSWGAYTIDPSALIIRLADQGVLNSVYSALEGMQIEFEQLNCTQTFDNRFLVNFTTLPE